jgi:glucose-6-phosphate isomerase
MMKIKLSKKPNAKHVTMAKKSYDRLRARKDLGYLQLVDRDENWRVSEEAAHKLSARGPQLTVLGMGGSALGGQCMVNALTSGREVQFLYNTDPRTVQNVLLNEESLKKNQYVVISKSGNTLEIACMLDLLLPQLRRLGRKLSESLMVVTEEKPSALYNLAVQQKIEIVAHPKDVGGRFSVFSPVGLIPLAFASSDNRVPLADVRAGVKQALQDKKNVIDLAAFYIESFKRKEMVSAFWAYSDRLESFLPWLIQLWAESLAKKGGPAVSTPVGYLGTCDQHSVLQQLMEGQRDKAICFLRESSLQKMGPQLEHSALADFAYTQNKNLGEIFYTQSLSTEEALKKAKRTTLSIEIETLNAITLAQLMMTFELLIGVLGEALKIDAFNQPGVELGKKITKEKLQKSSRL